MNEKQVKAIGDAWLRTVIGVEEFTRSPGFRRAIKAVKKAFREVQKAARREQIEYIGRKKCE